MSVQEQGRAALVGVAAGTFFGWIGNQDGAPNAFFSSYWPDAADPTLATLAALLLVAHELADAVHQSRSRLTHTISRMENAGLVEMIAAQDVQLAITDKYMKLHEQIEAGSAATGWGSGNGWGWRARFWRGPAS